MSKHYIAGWNTPGALPLPGTVALFEHPDEAARYLHEQVDLWWDQDYDALNPHTREQIDERYLQAHTMLHNLVVPLSEAAGEQRIWVHACECANPSVHQEVGQ